jgi:4-diphosphocytidyl-2-C-methyl-D-erythritol kinase
MLKYNKKEYFNMQNIYKQKAFAKVNLILEVLNKRSDGYHNIFSLMHRINLADVITIQPLCCNEIRVKCNVDLEIPQEKNIVYKAATALLEYTKKEKSALIQIEKNIPTGAGLGGGSSDAATTLLLLNLFWGLCLPMKTLYKIAITLGSDVPFFLEPYPKWVYGKGEHCEVLDIIQRNYYANGRIERSFINCRVLLVYPQIHIDTGLAYQKLNRPIEDIEINDDTYLDDIVEAEQWIIKSRMSFLRSNMINDFEEVVFEAYPEIKEIHNILFKFSRGKASLTGSGSAVFALFNTQEQAKAASFKIKKIFERLGKNYTVISTKLIP